MLNHTMNDNRTEMQLRVIDSHTEGEPTRVIVGGGPTLQGEFAEERRAYLEHHHDDLRRTVIFEPRGCTAMVGALLATPLDPSCDAAVIFFNNTGYLSMCGHGAIGVAVTLGYLGQVSSGDVRIETPAGIVTVTLHDANEATIRNVPSYRARAGVELDVPDLGIVRGDVAWGGNWFFLCETPPNTLEPGNIPSLTAAAVAVKNALRAAGIVAPDDSEIDHIEFFGDSPTAGVDSRNFVLCPGNEYDRSPCGTGTSAKIACLAEDGRLAPGQAWEQESIIGGRFRASYSLDDSGHVIPSITGRAFICGEATLVRQAGDPFACGIDLS